MHPLFGPKMVLIELPLNSIYFLFESHCPCFTAKSNGS